MISLMTSATMTVCALSIAIAALKKYVSHSKNFEFILYWGLSFVLIAIAYTGYALEPLVSGNANIRLATSHSIHIITTFAWFLQLYAVAYVTKFCPRYDTPQCRHCKVCKRKLIRISMEALQVTVIVAAVAIGSLYSMDMFAATDLRVIGILPLDIFYEVAQGLISLLICVLLFPYRKFKINLYLGFAVVAVAKVMQVVNIFVTKYTMVTAIQVEWALMTAGLILILLEVMNLINHLEGNEK